MGSLQPEAEGSPTTEVAATISFERAVTRRPMHPLARPILAQEVGFGQGRHEQRPLGPLADTG